MPSEQRSALPASAESQPSPARRDSAYSQYVSLTSGPCILLQFARLGTDAAKAQREGVYVQMWMVDHQERCLGGIASWPPKEGTAEPLWNSARQLSSNSSTALEQLRLRIELWHAAKQEKLIGWAHVPASSLSARSPLTITLRRLDDDGGDDGVLLADAHAALPRHAALPSQTTVTIQQIAQPGARKQVFFVRHGESRWNEAQRRKDVLEMMSHVGMPRAICHVPNSGPQHPLLLLTYPEFDPRVGADHPLNETGYQQASS